MAAKRVTRPSPIITQRLTQCRRLMKRNRVSAYLVSGRMDSFYLTGFTGEDSAVLILPRAVHIISDGRFDESINQECPWATKWLRQGLLNAEIGRVCKHLKIKSLGVQGAQLRLADFDELKKLSRPTRLVPAPAMVADLRRFKEKTDVSSISRAIRVAQEAFEATKASIAVGQTELEIAARLEFEMKIRGASDPSFPTICAEGPNAALPHAFPGRRKVKKGSAILLDWGARVGFYCSDLTRMLFVGSIPPAIRRIYPIVLEAQQQATAAIRPGKRMCDIDAVARALITKAGYGKEFNHGLGHGLGLDVHEPPSLSWRSDEVIKEGMLVTVEPGIYLPGIGGVRIEDDVLVTSKGSRTLTRLDSSLDSAVI